MKKIENYYYTTPNSNFGGVVSLALSQKLSDDVSRHEVVVVRSRISKAEIPRVISAISVEVERVRYFAVETICARSGQEPRTKIIQAE